MDGDSNRIFLKTGDLIVLQSETDDGYFSVSLEDYKGSLSHSKNHDKKTEVVSPASPSASASSSTGTPSVTVSAPNEEVVSGESAPALHRQLEGRAVVYGQVLQLQHITTSRFLAAKVSNTARQTWGGHNPNYFMGKSLSPETEEAEGNMSPSPFGMGQPEPRNMYSGGMTGQVMLTKGSRKRCWFRLMPRFKVQGRGEGDKIYVDENVCLVHVKSGQFVVSGVSSEYGDLTPTIGLSISLAGWKLALYNIVGDGFVKPGDALRLFHEEGGYLSRAGSADGNGGVYLLGHGPRALYTYGTIWQLEPEEEGGMVGYSMPVRIRLLHHDLFLSLTDTNPQPEHALATSASSVEIHQNTPSQSRETMWMSLTSSRSNDTLFVLHAVRSQNASGDVVHTQIPYGHYVRVQHARTRRWVHCVDMFKQSPSHMMVGWKYREVVASKAFDHNNIFLVQPIPQEHVDASFYVRTRMPVLQEFLHKLSTTGTDSVQIENAERVLLELVKFCTKTPNPDPIPEHQALLIAQEPIQLLVSILKALPLPSSPVPQISSSTPRTLTTRQKEKDNTDPWLRVRKTIFLLFRQICKQNHKNGRTLAAHLDVIIPWFGYPEMDVVETLTEMFHENELILDTQFATTALHAALNLLRSPSPLSGSMRALNAPPPSLVYTHDPRVLDFLSTLCSSGLVAFPHNQNDIAAAIFAPPLGPPISTRLTSTAIEVLVPPPPHPNNDASDVGVWVDLAKLAANTSSAGVKGMFSAATIPTHQMQCAQWVTAQLNLAAMVCMGQNYKSIHLVEGCHSWKEAFKALVQSTIPFDVSILLTYCRVVLHVFVDRFPQHHIAGSMTVAPLSDIRSFQTTAASEQPQEKGDVVIKKARGAALLSASSGSMSSGYDTAVKESTIYTPKNLQEFLVYFVQEESNLPESAGKAATYSSDQLNFFRAVLVLLRHSVSFGFFKIPALETSFLPRFSAILQLSLPTTGVGGGQTSSTAKRSPKNSMSGTNKRRFFTRQNSFYLKNEANDKPKLLLEVKMEVLRIIDTYLSMHAKDQFISFVLGYLQDRKQEETSGLLKSPTDPKAGLLAGSNGSSTDSPIQNSDSAAVAGAVYGRTNTQEEHELREQLKVRLKSAQILFTYQRSWYNLQQTLGTSMGGLLWHPSSSLVNTVMNILVRIQRNRSGVNSDLHLAIQSVMILVSEPLVKSYQQILTHVHRLRELLSHYHATAAIIASSSGGTISAPGASPLPQLTVILDTLRTMCLNNNTEGDDVVRVAAEVQRVLRNVNAHEHTMRVLALAQEDAISSLSSPEQTDSKLAFEAAIAFLRIFCYHNAQNQNSLFPHLDFLIGLMIRTNNQFDCADCIAEIFRDNYALCTRVKARHAEAFVSLIVKHGREFKFLSFFKVIPVASGIPIKSNQLLVLRMIASHATHTLPPIPWKGNAAGTSEVLYHAALLDILGLCSFGMNHSAEAYCQSLVGVSQCVRIIGDSATPLSVRAAYCRFLDEVYLNTEAPITSVVLLHQNDRFWSLLQDTFAQVLEHFLSIISTHARPKPFSRLRTDSLLAPHNRAVLRPKRRAHSGSLSMNNIELLVFTSEKEKAAKGKMKEEQDGPRTDLELRDFVFSSILPLLSNFCRHFTVSEATKEQHVSIIVHLWEQMRALEGWVVGPARAAVGVCMRAMQATGFTPPHYRRYTHVESNVDEDEDVGADPPVLNALDLLDLSEINLSKIYFPLAHQLQEAAAVASHSSAHETLIDVVLSFIKLTGGLGRGKELEAGTGGGVELNPHSDDTSQLALHMLNMTSSLLAVHGINDWEHVTQLGTLEGMISVLSLVCVHAHPILNPPIVLRGLKVLVAILESAPEARATAAQLVFSRTNDDMNLCELLVVLLVTAADALGSIGRANANASGGSGYSESGDLTYVALNEFDVEDPYHQYLNVLYIVFQLVESVCRGDSHSLKTYLRHQGDHLRSYDVIKGTVQALRQLEQLVLGRTISIPFGLMVLAQCCRTIRATVTGVPSNQAAVVDMRVVVHTCSRMLLFAFEVKDPAEVGPAFELMLQILDLIFSLIEGNPDPSPIIVSLDFKVLEMLTSLLARDTDSEEVRAQLEKLASMALRVVKVLAELDTQNNGPVQQALQVMEEHCKLRIGRIEFIRDSKLERLYFPIPGFCRGTDEAALQIDLEDYLSHEAVSWNNPTAKLELFVEWVGDLSRRLALHHRNHVSSLWSVFRPSTWINIIAAYPMVWTYTTLLISFVISVIILSVMNTNGHFPHHVGALVQFTVLPAVTNDNVTTLSCIHIVLSLFQVADYFRQEGPLLHFQYWKKYLPHSGLLVSGSMMSLSFSYFFRQLKHTLATRGFTLRILIIFCTLPFFDSRSYLIFSILGLAVSPLFYAFHLFQIVFRSRHLNIVLRAITMNASKLFLMAIFAFCVLFVFAIVNWRFFSHLFESNNMFCDTVLMCLLSNLYFGVGQTGAIMQSLQAYTWSSTSGQLGMLFNFFFFVAFGIIALNLVFAVIVDSFGELRDNRAEAQREKFRRCFICSIEREIFQRRSVDFYRHIHDDHSPWHWLYFFIHLQTKLRKDFTSHEEYIYRKIETGDHLSFFPVDRAVCLEADEAKENKMDYGFAQSTPHVTAALARRIVSLESRISALIGQLEHQSQSSSSIPRSQSSAMHPKPSPASPMSPSINIQPIPPQLSPVTVNVNESSLNLLNIDTTMPADYPFPVPRPRRLTKGSATDAGASLSPPSRAPSAPNTVSQRHLTANQKKKKMRENAEHLLSGPAYRTSALSLADMTHHMPSASSSSASNRDRSSSRDYHDL